MRTRLVRTMMLWSGLVGWGCVERPMVEAVRGDGGADAEVEPALNPRQHKLRDAGGPARPMPPPRTSPPNERAAANTDDAGSASGEPPEMPRAQDAGPKADAAGGAGAAASPAPKVPPPPASAAKSPPAPASEPQPKSPPPAAPAPAVPEGAVVITEVMPDPSARSDADGEWLELYNATSKPIELAGCALGDGSGAPRAITGPLRIEARGYATIANTVQPGFAPSIASPLSLNNAADIIELRCDDTLIDRVAYDKAQGSPIAAGAAMSLDPAKHTASANDAPSAWCLASVAYSTDRGTPGARNTSCTQQPPEPKMPAPPDPAPAPPGPPPTKPVETGAADAPSPARTTPVLPYGAVLLTEIMPDPAARSDAQGEWLELHNTTHDTIDLAGCALGDGATEPHVIEESARIGARAHITIASAPEPGFGASVVMPLSLRNAADVIELRCGNTLIDRVAYDKAQGFPFSAGASAALDPAHLDADANDAPSAWCRSTREYAGDLGTPGAANPPCGIEPAEPPPANPSVAPDASVLEPEPAPTPDAAAEPVDVPTPMPDAGPEPEPTPMLDAGAETEPMPMLDAGAETEPIPMPDTEPEPMPTPPPAPTDAGAVGDSDPSVDQDAPAPGIGA